MWLMSANRELRPIVLVANAFLLAEPILKMRK
jgi:hypothetical protein